MSSGAASHNVRNRVPGDFGSVHRLVGAFEPFISRRDRVVYEGKRGAVRTLEVRGRQWDSLLDGHVRGAQRIGLFPTLKTGRCRWGCLDLDAHNPSTPDRHADGVALLDFLDGLGVAGYMATSRGGRGVHVWVFFDGPGVPAPDLHGYLEALARELRLNGPVDVFPRSATGDGGAALLPYFGGTLDMLACRPEARRSGAAGTKPGERHPQLAHLAAAALGVPLCLDRKGRHLSGAGGGGTQGRPPIRARGRAPGEARRAQHHCWRDRPRHRPAGGHDRRLQGVGRQEQAAARTRRARADRTLVAMGPESAGTQPSSSGRLTGSTRTRLRLRPRLERRTKRPATERREQWLEPKAVPGTTG